MDRYPFWCRSPIPFEVTGTHIRLDIVPASGPAGALGENLLPGEGAWVDRALRPGEPQTIVIEPKYFRDALTLAEMATALGGVYAAAALTTALLTPDTLIQFILSNTGSVLQWVDSNPGTRSTPDFSPLNFRRALPR